VEFIFTIKSNLSLNGGHAITGLFVFHATTQDSALDLHATVINITLSLLYFSIISKTCLVCLCADQKNTSLCID